jgi:hypothetical protein
MFARNENDKNVNYLIRISPFPFGCQRRVKSSVVTFHRIAFELNVPALGAERIPKPIPFRASARFSSYQSGILLSSIFWESNRAAKSNSYRDQDLMIYSGAMGRFL